MKYVNNPNYRPVPVRDRTGNIVTRYVKISTEKVVLYHGTSVEAANKIRQSGFITDASHNWDVHSKPNFVYLSKAYAPFYAMTAKSKNENKRAIIKVKVDLDKLYPEDDFIMYVLGKPRYTQGELDIINLEDYKGLVSESLKYMGNACAYPEDIQIVGITEFDSRRLMMVCDPSISPINYKVMGTYYERLSEWLYQGNSPSSFNMRPTDNMEFKW